MHPSPSLKPNVCPKWEVSVNVELGEGQGTTFPWPLLLFAAKVMKSCLCLLGFSYPFPFYPLHTPHQIIMFGQLYQNNVHVVVWPWLSYEWEGVALDYVNRKIVPLSRAGASLILPSLFLRENIPRNKIANKLHWANIWILNRGNEDRLFVAAL